MDNGKGGFDSVSKEFVEEAEQEKLTALKNSLDKLAGQEETDTSYIRPGGGPVNFYRIDRIFRLGEEIPVKGSRFKVRSIDHVSGIMTLKLLPRRR